MNTQNTAQTLTRPDYEARMRRARSEAFHTGMAQIRHFFGGRARPQDQ